MRGSDVADQQETRKRAVFEELALVHLDGLHNLALKLTRSATEAEDLVQETYLRAYRFFDRFERGTNCKAWLYRILRNCFVSRYRADRGRPEEVSFAAIEGTMEGLVEEDFHPVRLDPEEALSSARIQEAVEKALGEIPADYRAALVLCLVEGFGYREVASILRCPIGTVMSRIHRARRLLQERLAGLARSEGIGAPETGGAKTGARDEPCQPPVDLGSYRRRCGRDTPPGEI